jgi:hypothetical protein
MIADIAFPRMGGQEQTSRHPIGEEGECGPSPTLALPRPQVEQHALKNWYSFKLDRIILILLLIIYEIQKIKKNIYSTEMLKGSNS